MNFYRLKHSTLGLLFALSLLCNFACSNKDHGPVLSKEESFNSGPLNVKIGIEKQTLLIADTIKVHLWAAIPKGFFMKNKIPEIKDLDQRLTLTEAFIGRPTMIDGIRNLHISYTFISYEKGEYQIPPIALSMTSIEQEGQTFEITTNPISLKIDSIFTESNDRPADISDPLLPDFKPEPKPIIDGQAIDLETNDLQDLIDLE